MTKLQNKIYKFMYGRNGADDLYIFCIVLYFIIAFINIFIKSIYLNSFEIILFALIIFRSLSKNIIKRQKENRIYLELKEKICKFFRIRKRIIRDWNTNLYRKCPKCKTMLKLPLKKGKHTVKCPHCENRFQVKCRRNEKLKIEIIK